MYKGIDISYHQGNIDFGKVKNQVDFVMIRSGYGMYQEDKNFRKYADECERLKIPYGFYHYSYARNIKEADIEVTGMLNSIKSYNPTYPIAIDMEDSDNWKANNGNPSNRTYQDICEYFCNKLEENGYYAIIYANKDWLENRLNTPRLDRFDKWLAQWGEKPTYNKPFGMWQYSNQGVIDGINGRVDLNIAYLNYPAIIKKDNQTSPKDQVLNKGDKFIIPGVFKVDSVSAKMDAVASSTLADKPFANYNYIDASVLTKTDKEGVRTANQVFKPGDYFIVPGIFVTLKNDRKTDAVYAKIGKRKTWIKAGPCYEV